MERSIADQSLAVLESTCKVIQAASRRDSISKGERFGSGREADADSRGTARLEFHQLLALLAHPPRKETPLAASQPRLWQGTQQSV